MIPVIIGIFGAGLLEFSHSNNDLSVLAIENIEALTEGTELPEITITCNSGYDGQCFERSDRQALCGEYFYYPCEYKGNPRVSCKNPCNYNNRPIY